jgi:hypothetical protein
MAKNFEKLIFGGLHEKHAVQRGIWALTQPSLWDQGKPRKTRTIRNTQIQSLSHRKHITSPLRAQQVNAIYRFVTMVY